LPKTLFSRALHGIRFAIEFDHGRVFNKSLSPYR
jgi:hypothetical protein